MSKVCRSCVTISIREVLALPIMGVMLLVLGLVEYPYARYMENTLPVLDATSYLRHILLMVLPSVSAFLLGWKLRWLDRVEKDVQPAFWIGLAFALALLPQAFGWSYALRPAWRLDIPGVALSVDAGLASLIAFFAWFASLKVRSADGFPVESLGIVFLLWFGWLCVVRSGINDYFLYANFLVLPVVVIILRGSPYVKATLSVVFLWLGWWLFLLWWSPYRLQVLASNFYPFYDPYGYNWAAIASSKALDSSGLFGSFSLILLPRAADQYMLLALARLLFWLGIGLVIITGILFFILAYSRLIKRQISWLRDFSICIWGFLLLGSIVSLVATLGLTNRPGLGIQFISHNWVLAALAAFVTGVTLRDEKILAGMVGDQPTGWPKTSPVTPTKRKNHKVSS